MKSAFKGFLFLSAIALASGASAVTQTTGSGSAVTVVDGSADFETAAALYSPYSEGGMLFDRTGLTDNNNSCGFAGCPGWLGFTGFSGNYMYGTGNGYFTISAQAGHEFHGLEFQVGTGFWSSTTTVNWIAFDDGVQVGSGSVSSVSVGSVIGFVDAAGFDELRYSDGAGAPAFDSVRAQFVSSAVPEPTSYALALAGLATVGAMARRRRGL